MTTRRQRSGLRGVTKLRRTLRRIDPDITREVREEVERVTERILADMQSMVPKDTGDLAAALDKRVARDGLTARVGLVTKAKQRDFFYARFIEFGTKEGKGPHPQEARPFMQPAFDVNETEAKRRITQAINDALRRAASG
jgi:HK97 gp10 family phage protein